MSKSKISGLQDNTNAATKPNSSTIQGGCNKQKFALWAYPTTLEEVDKAYEGDNCKSKSEFIEKAINFYLDYLKQENNINYLAPRITSSVDAVVHGTEQRINRNLFKIAVELGIVRVFSAYFVFSSAKHAEKTHANSYVDRFINVYKKHTNIKFTPFFILKKLI